MYAADTNDQDISAGNITATGTITAANNKFQVNADGTLSAVGGRFNVDENNIKLGYLTINATNDGITFTDTNRSNSFTIADIHTIDYRTQKVGMGSTSYGNVEDTFTSLGGKLKVYDKHKVAKVGTNPVEYVETSLDLVTINEGYQNQVSMDTVDGIVISHQGNDDPTTTAAMNEKGVFAGGKDYTTAKAGMSNVDGSLKAANGNFTVDKDGNTNVKGTLTTKKLITDELVITGSGTAGGSTGGSIAFGGSGTIKSNIKGEAGTDDEGKETNFETSVDGVTTKVTDGTHTTTVTTTANGTTFTKDDKTTKIDGGNISADGTLSVAGGKFKVDADGKVIFNEGTKNQVRIDSNGIKVGNNSAFISDDGFKSSGDLYIGTKTAPTEAAIDARFYVKGSDGSVKAADGKFTVEADGGFTAADGKFKVDGDGNLEVKDAAGNSKSINLSEMADMSQDVARMNNRISDVSDRVNKVGAMSAAIASLKTIGYDPEAPTEFSVGLGQYKSETGLALGIFHYPNRNMMFNLSLSTSGGETMGGIGATWRIGHDTSQKQMKVAVQDDVEKVIVKKEDYEALQAQVNQLAQVVQQLVAEKEAAKE